MSKKELANKKVVKAISLGLATALTMMQPMTALADEGIEGAGSVEPITPEIVEESNLPTVQEVVAEAKQEVKEAKEAADDVVISVKVPLINKDFDIPLEEKIEVLEKKAQKDLKDAEGIVEFGDKIIDKEGYLEDVVLDEEGQVVDIEGDFDETAIDDNSVNDINAAEDAIDKITDGSIVTDEETGEAVTVPSVQEELTSAIDNADQLLANQEGATYGEALEVAGNLKDVVDKTQALVEEADAAVAKAEGTLAAAEKQYEAAKKVSDIGAELAAKEVEKAKYETAVAYQNAEKIHSVLDNAKTKLDKVQATIHDMQAKNEEKIATASESLENAKVALTESVENLKEEAGELKESVGEFKDQVGELKDSIDNFIDKVEVAKETQDTLDGLYGEYYAAQMNYENMLNSYNNAILKWNDWALNYDNLTDEQKAQVELAVGAANLDKICKGMTNLVKTDGDGKPVYDENGRVVLSDEVQKDAMASADNSLVYQLYAAADSAKSAFDTAEETYNNINDEKVNGAIVALKEAIAAGNDDTSEQQQALGAALIQKYLAKGAEVTWVAHNSDLEGTYGQSDMGYYVVTSEGKEGFDVYGYTYDDENGTLNVVSINSTVTDHFEYNGQTYDVKGNTVTIDNKEYTLNTDIYGNKYFVDQKKNGVTAEEVNIPEKTTASVGFIGKQGNAIPMEVSKKTGKDGVYELAFTADMKAQALDALENEKEDLDKIVAEEKKGKRSWEQSLIDLKYDLKYKSIDIKKIAVRAQPTDGTVKFTFESDGNGGYTKPSYLINLNLFGILPLGEWDFASKLLEVSNVKTTPADNYSQINVGGTNYRLNNDDNGYYYEKNDSKVYVDGIENEDGNTYYFERQNGTFTKGKQGHDSVYSNGAVAQNDSKDVSNGRYTAEHNDALSAYDTAKDNLATAKTTYADAVNEYTKLEAKFKDFSATIEEKDRTNLVIAGVENPLVDAISGIIPGSDTAQLISELGTGADLSKLPKGIGDLLKVEDLKLITDPEQLADLGNSLKTLAGNDASVVDKVKALKTISEFMPNNIDINAMVTAYIIANASEIDINWGIIDIDGKEILEKMNVTEFQINYAKSWVDALNAKVEVVKAGLDVANETGETIAKGIDVIKEGVETGEAITDTTLKSVEVALKAVALGGAKMDKGILAVADLIVDKLDGFVSDLEAKAEKAKNEAKEAQNKVAALEKMAPKSQELAMAREALDAAQERLADLNGELSDLQGTLERAKELQEEAQELANSLYREHVNNNNNDNGGQGGNGGAEENQDYSGGTTGGLETVRNAVVLSDEDMALFAQAVADQAVLGARQSRGSRVVAKVAEEVEEAAPAEEKVAAPVKEVEELAETPEEDIKKVVEIEDTKTALAGSLTEEEKAGMNWWWLLLVAVLGATGVAMYRNYQKKKATAQTTKSDK